MGNQNARTPGPLRKPYEKPTVTKLTREEAKQKLIDHASRGDQCAQDILEAIFPEEAERVSNSKKTSA